MHVPVDDQDPRQALLLLRVTGRDGDVVEQAEAHATLAAGVMPRRPHRAERVADLACGHGIDGAQHTADGGQRRLVRFPRHGRIAGIQVAGRLLATSLDPLDVLRRMDAGQPTLRVGTRLQAREAVQKSVLLQTLPNGLQPFRPLRMMLAGPVPQADFAVQQARW